VLPEGEDDAVAKIVARGVGVDRYPLDRRSPSPSRGVRSIAAMSRAFARHRFDVVHTFAHEPNLYGAAAARVAGVPVLITQVTGLGRVFADASGGAARSMAQHLLMGAYRLMTRLSTAVVFHNRDDAGAFTFVEDERKVWLASGSGVDTEKFSPEAVSPGARASLRRELGIAEDVVVLTFVGRLVRHKGIHEFLAVTRALAAARARADVKVRFLVVGGPDEGNKRSVSAAQLRQLADAASVTFLGARPDVRELLAVTDVFVNPSLREGLPRANLEAMAMGKPLVAFDVPGSRDTVEHGRNGLLVPRGDDVALTKAAGALVADAAARARMGHASRRRAVEHYDVALSVDRIAALYARFLSARPARAAA